MSYDTLPDIPRAYTAIAEWAACIVYIMPLKKRIQGIKLAFHLVAALLLQLAIQRIAGQLPITFWLPGMMFAVTLMYFYILIPCNISLLDAGYCCARAFITAEFAASFLWQVYCISVWNGLTQKAVVSIFMMIGIYSAIFLLIFFLESRRIPKNTALGVNLKELLSAVLMVLAAFIMNNINFVLIDTERITHLRTSILYIRTLVDFCGMILLYAQHEQRKEIQLRKELDAMNYILNRQYDQYQQSKESIQLINLKYHDLKHQIELIRSEANHKKKESYLAEMDKAVSTYGSQNKTGNPVLDVVLTTKSLICTEKGINMTCVADGSLLSFMDAMDICTIFGNTLENAIESVKKLSNKEKQLIRVAVYSQNNFIMIRVENYFEDNIIFEDGLPTTTKKDKDYHGYGIKSIQKAAQKYGGNITINTDNNWFILRVLIPIPLNYKKL